MVRTGTARRACLAGAVLLALAPVAAAFGQSPVLDVAPEGVVIDAAQLPDLQPGARIGFRRSDADPPQVGEGFVLDVREGRALIGLKPGSDVQAGDLAVPCASLSGSGSQQENLRDSVQNLKTQLASAGGGSAELQAAVGQLETTLDEREAAIRDGACDVAAHDQQIADLSLQLQQMLAALAGAASPGAVPPPAPPEAAHGAAPGQEAAPGGAPGPPPPIGQGGTAMENIALALQVAQQLFQMAQSAGLIPTAGQPGVQQPGVALPSPEAPPSSEVLLPTEPPPGEATSPVVETPPPSPPPVVVSPPSPPPPSLDTEPTPGTRPPPGKPPGDRTAPPVVKPPVRTRPPGSRPPWWTVTPPRPPTPAVGAVPGSPPSPPRGRTASGDKTAPGTMKPLPGITQPQPGGATAPLVKPPPRVVTVPTPAPIARVPPTVQRMATVQGVVRADNGRPIAGALVSLAGKQVKTNTRGVFVVTGVPLGRRILLVTAGGFSQGKLALELSSGEVEKVALTLRRATPSAPPQTPR